MKKYRFIASLALAALAAAMFPACDGSDDPVVYTEPEVTFSTEQTTFDIELGETVEITADVQPEGKVYIKWYVDELLESTSAEFSYTFNEPGKHTVAFSARNGSGEVTRDFTVNVADVFDVELSIGDEDVVEIDQYELLTVVAIVNSGQDITHNWYLEGNLISNERILEYQMMNPGRQQMRYEGYNTAGRYERSFWVDVKERGLYIEMSYDDDLWQDWIEEDIEIIANVIYGGSTARHSWKLNGQEVSTDNRFFKNFAKEEEGEYTLLYECTTDDEYFSREYTLKVWYGWLISDFESATGLDDLKPFIDMLAPEMGSIYTLLESEKDALNSSSKVLKQEHTNNIYTSGIMDLYITSIPKFHLASRLSFLYNNVGNNRTVVARYWNNGNEQGDCTVSTVVSGYNGWQQVDVTFDPAVISTMQGFRIRPLTREEGGPGVDWPNCYMDNIYLYKY
ncbi:MAG: PKD domain-containing protein [Alistipes sp.]|nr:PKD domain-containing protein [Alistipes sp.]